jgi:hypothetical protein
LNTDQFSDYTPAEALAFLQLFYSEDEEGIKSLSSLINDLKTDAYQALVGFSLSKLTLM